MHSKKLFIIAILTALFLSGCQEVSNKESSLQKTSKPASANPVVVDHGIPFSKGPTTPPEVKGPGSDNPVTAAQAQAVTKSENIRLTLPLKTDTKGE